MNKVINVSAVFTSSSALLSAFILLSALFTPGTAQAGLINQHVSFAGFNRECPGLADSNYLNDYGPAMDALYGSRTFGGSLTDSACIFNSKQQSQFWNFDGSPKGLISGLPSIPPFTAAQVGNLDLVQKTATNNLSHYDSTMQGEISLDSSNLGLPELKLNIDSTANERNSFNGYAVSEYLWTGADETLEFNLNFDFHHSSDMWSVDGIESIPNSDLFLTAYVSQGLVIDPLAIFPADTGTILASSSFNLNDAGIAPTTPLSPYYGSIGVSFDVTAGQSFFLVGQYQAFAKNGGYLDAFNTVTGSLLVQGLDEVQSKVIFENSLSLAPISQVSAPGALGILLFSFGLLLLKRRY